MYAKNIIVLLIICVMLSLSGCTDKTDEIKCDQFVYGPFCDPFFEMDREFVDTDDMINANSLVVPCPLDGNNRVAGRVIKIVDFAYEGIYLVETHNGPLTVNSMWLYDTGLDYYAPYRIERETRLVDGDLARTYFYFFNGATDDRVSSIVTLKPYDCDIDFRGSIMDVVLTDAGYNLTISTIHNNNVIIEVP